MFKFKHILGLVIVDDLYMLCTLYSSLNPNSNTLSITDTKNVRVLKECLMEIYVNIYVLFFTIA